MWEKYWFVFALVCAWKIALLVFTAQPIPGSDAYFYDGAVVHALNGGAYANPSLSLILPISGNEIFSAYPPLHQAALWTWMRFFGTGVLSAMWFQFAVFAVYGAALVAIFRTLPVGAGWANLACLFLFGLTFLDRPDTLAFACGMWGVCAALRANSKGWHTIAGNSWHWLAFGLAFLSTSASLHIGAAIFAWLFLIACASSLIKRVVPPLLPFAVSILILATLIVMVRIQCPRIWAGFLEHVRETPTPTFGAWSTARPWVYFRGNILKLLRTAPALLLVLALALTCLRRAPKPALVLGSVYGVLAWTGLCVTAALVVACLGLLMQNAALWCGYMQPLLVGVFPAWRERLGLWNFPQQRYRTACYVLALIVGVRALGMSTWGVLCALDMNQRSATQLVSDALEHMPAGSAVVVSSAYLYEADRHKALNLFHSDWVAPYNRKPELVDSVVALKPSWMLLTQFDYYRGCGYALPLLRARPELLDMRVTNTARLRPPDASPWLQRTVQHVSWAPVLVELDWR